MALDFLDAPVTGSRMQAEAGQLSFLVGGNEAALEKATPALEGDEQRDRSSGPGGKRGKDETDQQFSVRSAGRVSGGRVAWIERSGLDREKALSVLKAGAPGSPLLGGYLERAWSIKITR